MSNDPWVVQPQEAKINYGQAQIVRTEKSGKNGNTYFEMKTFITPIEPEKKIVESTVFSFSPEFQKITIPSVLKLVNAGKLTSPSNLENNQLFVSYKWAEYKSYSARDIEYWRENNPDKLEVDNQGRTYKGKMAIEYVDVFPSMESWQAAYEKNAPVIVETATEIEPASADVEANNQIMLALPAIVQSIGTDMTKLSETLSHEQFAQYPITSPAVKNIVIKMVIDKCGTSPENIPAQMAMLAEINAHFPNTYIELTDLLGDNETPF